MDIKTLEERVARLEYILSLKLLIPGPRGFTNIQLID